MVREGDDMDVDNELLFNKKLRVFFRFRLRLKLRSLSEVVFGEGFKDFV